MNRPTWKSRKGGPLSIAEITVLRTAASLAVIAAMSLVTASAAAGFCVGLAAYLLMDRVQVIIDWAREPHAAFPPRR